MIRPVVYLVEVPTPYRNAEMDRAADGLGQDAVRVIFIRPSADGCFEYLLPSRCPYNLVDGPPETNGVPLDGLPDFLASIKPAAVIVGGYSQPSARRVLTWCREKNVRYCLRSDSNIWSDRRKGVGKYLVRRVRLGRWVRHAHRVLITGTYNRQFWQRYGMRPDQEGWWPQWIDYEHYAKANQLRSTSRDSLRDRFGIRTPISILHVGRLVRRKRVDLLCEALLESDPQVGLVIAGNGDQSGSLRARYAERLGDRLRFLGALQPEQLPALYAAGDALAVASGDTEPWGMVLNEACAAGLPIVCGRTVGAAGDLLVDGQNGIALARDDVASWAAALDRLASDPSQLAAMRERSVRIADAWRAGSEPAACLRPLLDN